MNTDHNEIIAAWRARDPDPATRSELDALLDDPGSVDELADRFNGRLDFGTAGLRGVVGTGPNRMNLLVVLETSLGLGRYLLDTVDGAAERGVVIGYDGRLDSARFARNAAAALVSLGIRVYLTDRPVPTPVCACGVKHFGAAAGVVLTASHNPPEYNGYKVYWGNGAQIVPPHDSGIADAIDIVAANPLAVIDSDAALLGDRVITIGDDFYELYLRNVRELSIHGDSGNRADFAIAYTAMHGVGAPFVERALEMAGFGAVYSVAEQREPDGHFPTVAFPNPEEPGAMDLVEALARKHNATIAIANDPDADRLAVSARDADGHYRMLSGNQVGILLGSDRIAAAKSQTSADTAAAKSQTSADTAAAKSQTSADTAAAKSQTSVGTTIVSSQMLGVMAQAANVGYFETLTGFKWIANVAMDRKAQNPHERFAFGYEEALGYTVGELVRDKDGVSAAMAFAELAAELARKGHTVFDELERLYRQFGLFVTAQKSIWLTASDQDGPSLTDRLRISAPDQVGGRDVLWRADLREQHAVSADGTTEVVDLPVSDVLIYRLEGGARIIVRPSGTEPKVKSYYEVRGTTDTHERFEIAEQRARAELAELVEIHQAELAALRGAS